MIRYLRSIGEFGFSIAAKVVDWLAESLLSLKKFLSRRTSTTALTNRRFAMSSTGEEGELESGLGSVRFSPGLERTTILISSSVRESLSSSAAVEIPVAVESPPPIQEGVDNDDLNNLKLDSNSIREASLIAERIVFAYTTPEKTRPFRNSISDSTHQADDIEEPPRAPKRARLTKVMRKEQLSSVSVNLFP